MVLSNVTVDELIVEPITCKLVVPDTVSIVFVSNLLIIKLRMYSLMELLLCLKL